MILRLILLLVCMAFERVFTLYGADLDALVILDSFECLKKSRNHQFAIISVSYSVRNFRFSFVFLQFQREWNLKSNDDIDWNIWLIAMIWRLIRQQINSQNFQESRFFFFFFNGHLEKKQIRKFIFFYIFFFSIGWKQWKIW